MAVPLIVNVQPRFGPTGGLTLIEITANNLRTPPPPPPTGQSSGVLLQTVQVLFGTAEATDVNVFSKGKLTCLAPVNNQGEVDVTINNLDDLGVPIPGETATRTDIYLYSRPDLKQQTDFTRIVRTLIRLIKQQVIDEVTLTRHTDFDGDTGDGLNITDIAKMPAIILVGPDVVENRFFSSNERQQVELNDGLGTIAIRRTPYTINIEFELVGVSDHKQQLLNLMAATIQWVNRNKSIVMDRDPDDLSLGTVEYELDFLEEGGEPTSTSRINNANVRSFSAKIVIRGFDVEDLAGVADDMVTEKATEITTEIGIDDVDQLNPTLQVIPSPTSNSC